MADQISRGNCWLFLETPLTLAPAPRRGSPAERCFHVTFIRSSARLAPIIALACVLAACGGDATDAQSSPEETTLASQPSDESFAEGYPLPDCSDAANEPCITNGFDPAVDGFGFANWGDTGVIGATEMIALFGRKRVCASGSGSTCVMYPAAKEWAQQVNEAMAGGHCEGMAVLSARLFTGDDAIAKLDPKATSTYDLDPSDKDVVSAIEMWFATQYLDPVVKAYKSYQKLSPTEIASALIDGLAENSGYTMGIYSPDGGHAITPLGVSFVGDQVAISVYDNNYPGTVQRIMVDPDTETWSYAAGTTNPNAPTNGWGGGTGTIELTPMESRALPAPAPFAEKRPGGRNAAKNQTIMVTSPDPNTNAGAILEFDGQSFDLTDRDAVLPEGVLVRAVRSDTLTAGSTVVDIDTTLVSKYAITATTENPTGAAVPVTISIDSLRKPRITMQAQSPSDGTGAARFTVTGTGNVVADSPVGAPGTVSIANGLRGVEFELDEENSLSIDTDDEGVATILLLDEDGETLGSFEVDAETEDGSVEYSDVAYDPETGEFDVTEVEAEAEEVDTEFLALVDDVVGVGADDETDAGIDAGTEEDAPGDEGADAGTEEDASVDEGADEGTLEEEE